jgi:glycosyltransferase involved in cell wall biosynthesis
MAEASVVTQADGRLRILFVTGDKFPPFRPAARWIFAEGLADHGHEIDWIAQAADQRCAAGPQTYKTGTAYVARTNAGEGRLARLRKAWAGFCNDWTVFRLLPKRDYSLIQVKDKYLGALIAIVAAKIYGTPVFYWLAYPHGEASLYAARNRVARYALFYSVRGFLQRLLLYRIIMPACTHVFVQSEQMRADVAREGIAPARTTAVPSSISLAAIDGAPRYMSTRPRHRPAIVHLGTLLRERRLDFLVRVLTLVRLRVPNAELVFVGRGENPADEDLLVREADRLGVRDAMSITGWLPVHAAWEHVRRAAACVSPYYPTSILSSTSPTKLVEYMALGKAVVANRHPEQTSVLHRSGGGLLCDWVETEFADALVFLLTNPEIAESMGRAGRRFVEQQRTHSAMMDLVVSRYRESLARAGAP